MDKRLNCKEMDDHATLVMNGESELYETVYDVVNDYATHSFRNTANDIDKLVFASPAMCSTAMRCVNDAKAIVEKLDDTTMLVYP